MNQSHYQSWVVRVRNVRNLSHQEDFMVPGREKVCCLPYYNLDNRKKNPYGQRDNG